MKECGSYSRFTVLGCTACSAGGKETDVRLLQTTEPMIQGAEGSQGGSRKKAVPEALEALTGLQSLGLKSAIALPERADKVVEKRRHVRLYLQMCVCVCVDVRGRGKMASIYVNMQDRDGCVGVGYSR